MPFFDTRTPQFQVASPQLIQQASINPFQVAGREMQKLDDALETRAYGKSIQGAKNIEELIGAGVPKTEAGQKMLASALKPMQTQQAFDIQRQQEQRLQEAQNLQFGTPEQRAAASTILGGIGAGITEEGQPQRQFTLPELQNVYATYGENPAVRTALEPLIKAAGSSGSRKPTSQEEYDRWFNEAEGLRARSGTLNTIEQARLGFLDESITKYRAGVGEVQGERKLAELERDAAVTSKLGEKYLTKPREATKTDLGRMKTIEARNYQNLDEKQQKLLADTTNTLKANHTFVSGVDKAFDAMNSDRGLPPPESGVIDSFEQKLSTMGGELITDERAKQMVSNIDFNTRAGRLLAVYIKATSGTAASDAERRFLQDLFSGGWSDDESAIIQRMKSFRSAMVDENDIAAGQIFDSAPYSATKYRDYREESAISIPREKAPVSEFVKGQRAVQGGITYEYDGTTWNQVGGE